MELQTVIDTINEITISESSVLRLYPLFEDANGEIEIRLADITDEAASDLKEMLLGFLNSKFIDNDDLTYSFLTQADGRGNTAYEYDLQNKPFALQMLADVLKDSSRPAFSFTDDDISGITGFIILIGDEAHRLTLYKSHHRLSTMKAKKSYSLFRSVDRFVKVDEDILRLSKHVEFVQIDDSLIVCDLNALERTFGYETVIREQAQSNINFINDLGLLDDIAPLVEMAIDLKHAKKLVRIKTDSPVTQLPLATVVSFVMSHKPIMKKFRLSDDGSKLRLDTMVSKKLFLALMNDDLLTSELTKLYYAGVAKDKMEIDDAE